MPKTRVRRCSYWECKALSLLGVMLIRCFAYRAFLVPRRFLDVSYSWEFSFLGVSCSWAFLFLAFGSWALRYSKGVAGTGSPRSPRQSPVACLRVVARCFRVFQGGCLYDGFENILFKLTRQARITVY